MKREKENKMKKVNVFFSVAGEIKKVRFGLKRIVKKAVAMTLREENFPHGADLSVTFCDNEYIRELNRKYRNKDVHTDVLSFPMFADYELEAMVPGEEPVLLGDIVISLERAAEQAVELGNSLKREVAFLAIHSTLHLLGYDHERGREDEELQCAKQRAIIEKLGIK